MSDAAIRLVVVIAVFVIAGAIAYAQRKARAVRRSHRSFPGIDPGVVLFVSAGCSTCRSAREALEGAGVGYREIAYDDHPDDFARLGIGRVPALASVDPSGEGWISYGVPTRSAVRRWLPTVDRAVPDP